MQGVLFKGKLPVSQPFINIFEKAGIKLSETAHEIDRGCGTYVAVDLETTGLDPKRERVIEIGAVKVINGVMAGEFSSFVNPAMEISEFIRELTGITDEMVLEAPYMETLIGDFIAFCGEMPILGHHIIFDYSFLKRAAVNNGLEFERVGIDTLSVCRQFMPEGEKKNLKAACRFYNISQETSHRALADAKAAHFLYQELLKRHGNGGKSVFLGQPLVYKVKKEQPATKKQKQGLRDLAKYHKISLTVQIESMTRNEVSRMTDKIILQYGRISKMER